MNINMDGDMVIVTLPNITENDTYDDKEFLPIYRDNLRDLRQTILDARGEEEYGVFNLEIYDEDEWLEDIEVIITRHDDGSYTFEPANETGNNYERHLNHHISAETMDDLFQMVDSNYV